MARKPPVVWYPAHRNNFTPASRPSSHRINRVIIHVTQGSWSSAVNWSRTRTPESRHTTRCALATAG